MSVYLYAHLQTAGADRLCNKNMNNNTSKKQVFTKIQRLRLNIRTEALQKAVRRINKQQNESLTADTEK